MIIKKGGYVIVNGLPLDITGLSCREIGEKIAELSKTTDGKGITVQLTEQEEGGFERVASPKVDLCIAELVMDAIEKKTGKRPEPFRHTYVDLVFKT